MSSNFEAFRDKHYLVEEHTKATEISKQQAFSSVKNEFIDPHIRILSDYPSGIVEYDVLSDSISALQKISQSVYNFAFGTKSKKGRLPNQIVEDSKLLITGMASGSFIVTFDSAINKKVDIPNESQTSLDLDNDILNNKGNSIDLLRDVLENIVNLESESDAENFLKDYGDRTYRESSNFLNTINNYNIDLDIGFGMESNKILTLRQDKIVDKINLLEHQKIITTKTTKDFSGKLTGVSNKRKELTFENEKETVIVKIIDDSLNFHKMVTNKVYDFKVQVELTEDVIRGTVISKDYLLESVEDFW